MSSALFIVLEKEIPEFDSFVNGKAVCNTDPELAKIAADLGIQPLMNFFAVELAREEYFLEEEEVENDTYSPAQITWHKASEGLITVQGLIDYLKENPNAIQKADEVLADLQDFARVLTKADQHQVRWYLYVDF